MIRVIYTYEVKPGQEDVFIDAWRRATRGTRVTTKGSKGGLLTRDAHMPTMFIAVTRWESLDALRAHLDSTLPLSEAAKTMRGTLSMPAALQVVSEIADLTINDA